MQVWFQNRRAKFRRNERSILAQRTQLQQFAVASVSRKCVSSSPSQFIDNCHHPHISHHAQQQQQQQCMPPAPPVSSVLQQSVWTSTWSAVRRPGYEALQSTASQAVTSAAVDIIYSTTSAATAAPLYNSLTTDNGLLQERSSVISADHDDRLLSTAAILRQRIKEFATAYTTQTTTNFQPDTHRQTDRGLTN